MKKSNRLRCLVLVVIAAYGLCMVHEFVATALAQTTGLVGHWKFDEASGATAFDSSISGNNLALTNGPSWAAGKNANGLQLNGINNYGQVSIRSGPWSGDYTISFWVKAGAVGQPRYAAIFNNFGIASTKDSLQIDVDGANPGSYLLTTQSSYSIAPVSTDWQFLAVTLTGTTLRTYNNGGLTNTYNLSAGESNVFRHYIVGVNRSSNKFFKGIIDDLRVYNRGLSAAEVQAIYNGTAQDNIPPVVANVAASSITTTNATILWTTDEPADSQVEYGINLPYGNATALNASLSLNHTQALTGLTPNTTYNYRVKSKDAQGNLTISQNFTFTTTTIPQTSGKPNIVLILADDLGWQGVGAYGQPLIQTPVIDRLAREGTLFTQAYAGSTECCPSRSALLTGQHTGHTRLRSNISINPQTGSSGEAGPLLPRDVTVAEVLKTSGYKTAIIGKWHTGAAETSGIPNLQGFDYFFGHLTQTDGAVKYFPTTLRENNQIVPVSSGVYADDLFTTKAIDFITQNRNERFFLHVTYNIPHAPFQVPSYDPYATRPWNFSQKAYAAMHTRMDMNIGRLMTALAELGIDQDTLVIFASDNGTEICCSENIDVENLFHTTGPLRGHKGSLYEGGIRVPFIARWPGRVPQNRVSNDIVALWDLLPTFAELANVPPARGIDGISLVPTLYGTGSVSREYLYFEFPGAGGSQAVRIGDWKGIRKFGATTLELYNLAADLSETTNVANSNPSMVAKMTAIMTTGRTVGAQDGFAMPLVDPSIVCRQREFLNGVDLLSYSGASPSCARLGLAAIGEKAYTDDSLTIASLPPAYSNQVLLRNANQDKVFQWSTFSRIAVRQPSTVAVAYDASASVLPSWLQSWTPTGEVVTVTGSAQGGITFNLYSKSFPQNATIFLGGNAQDGGNASRNYLVFVNTNNPPQASTGLVGRWSFDEPSGNVAVDSSGYEYDGLLYNGAVIGSGPARVNGQVGGALSFDGVNDFVFINTGDTRKGDYTVTLWVRAGRTAQPAYAGIFANLKNFGVGGTLDSFQIDVDGGSPGLYRLSTSGTRSYPIAPVSTQPQFLAVTLSGSTLRTYNNGSLTGTYTLAAGESNFSRDYLVGTNRAGNKFFHGAIDDVRIYDRALPAGEVTAIFNGTQ